MGLEVLGGHRRVGDHWLLVLGVGAQLDHADLLGWRLTVTGITVMGLPHLRRDLVHRVHHPRDLVVDPIRHDLVVARRVLLHRVDEVLDAHTRVASHDLPHRDHVVGVLDETRQEELGGLGRPLAIRVRVKVRHHAGQQELFRHISAKRLWADDAQRRSQPF